jgi:hypothetical protein
MDAGQNNKAFYIGHENGTKSVKGNYRKLCKLGIKNLNSPLKTGIDPS